MLISSLPYVYGWWLSTPQQQFSGFILGVEDANSYLAKMRMGAEGGWLFHLAYTPEPHAGAYLFTFHLALGKLARWFNVSPTLAYHLARLFFGLGLLLTIYCFISYFVNDLAKRHFAFLLIAVGSGLGWLLIVLQLTPWLGLPLDVYVPEGFIFLVLFHLPHLALAESLLFWSMLFTLRSWEMHAWLPILWAGLALLGMVVITVFYSGVYLAVLGLTWLALMVAEKSLRQTWLLGVKMMIPVAMTLPLLGYNAYIFTTNPALKIWSQQNLILSPEPHHYGLAYGLLIIPAIYGGWLLVKGATPRQRNALPFRNLVLIIWCLVFPILVYLPFNLQRRLVVGVQVPLAFLATYGIFELGKRYIRPARQRLWRGGVILFFALSNILVLLGSMATVSARPASMFLSLSQSEALNWLAEQARGEVIMAVYQTGNVLPAYANVRAFAGHGPETINSDEKRQQADLFFNHKTTDEWRRALLEKFDIQYVYYGPDEKAAGDFAPEHAPYLEELYRNEEVQIFGVNLSR